MELGLVLHSNSATATLAASTNHITKGENTANVSNWT